MVQPHFLVVTFPAQGHLNPGLQFSMRLIRGGALVTLATSLSASSRMAKTSFPEGLSLATFSDGYDDGLKSNDDFDSYISELRHRGSKALSDLFEASKKEGKPITALVYSLLLPWAAEVARTHNVPSALLWIQPAMVFDIYYYYFNGYGEEFVKYNNDPDYVIKLPGLPLLRNKDLPTFLLPSNTYTFAIPSFREQLEALEEESNPKILVNTFEELEPEALRAIDRFKLIPIGPLLPSGFLDDNDSSDTSFGGDLSPSSGDYIDWLNSKPKSSVVYASFGSLAVLSKRQMGETARGLIDSGCPFLWVIRADQLEGEKEDGMLDCREELEHHGKVVPWCSQVEVLSHPSLGCFLTHCGWNSTLESLASGVPVVAFPQWTDQGTNAKLIEDISRTGVRVVPNEEGVVESGEIRRCIDLVMGSGEIGEGLRSNARKWRNITRDALKEGGSSDQKLKDFVDEVALAPRCF